jgi:AcrR family transcriptional regulator
LASIACGKSGALLENLKNKVLTQMRPGGLGSDADKWQQRKSAETRVRIVEATIDCLVEKGYAGLSTNEVTARAGISRGAMHHHFASRMTLVAAVIDYTFYQRMSHFLGDYFDAISRRGEDGVVEVASEMHWQSVQTREYAAYLELAVAARTDSELAVYFEPAAKRYDRIWTDEMIKSFPQWQAHWDRLQIANDFAMAAHMGLLMLRPVFDRGEREVAVRDLITAVIKQLHQGI